MSRSRILYFTGLSMFLLGACGREAANEAVPAASPAASAQPAAAQAIAPGPATGATEASPEESGLAIKRGVVTGDGDHATFRACDDKAELWLLDENEGALTQLLTEDTTSLYVEAYGERDSVPDELVAARSLAGVFVLEQLLYAAPPGEMNACEQGAPAYVVAARGNEPFWAAQVMPTGMIWKQPAEPTQITLGDLQAEDAEGTVGYRASDAQHTLELHIEAQSCRDSMSGEYFAFAAHAVLDGAQFKGCARVGKPDAH